MLDDVKEISVDVWSWVVRGGWWLDELHREAVAIDVKEIKLNLLLQAQW